ncbi:MAG TPA: 50S ribosomal protein L5 [Candidatus Omnitrophica bacterium]|nr:50S ribosomal protein L5 [Candidatus Omnitrophota bacterium]
MPRLKKKYIEEVVPYLMQKFNYRNLLQVPRLERIVINMGIGEAKDEKKILDEACQHLSLVTGQKPVITKARKSIAGFKLRKGRPIGCKVTLRGEYMYEFLDRLINFALPRIRDFRGVKPDSFDRRGNYTLGIGEQYIFPEIEHDRVSHVLGMDICIVTTTDSDEEGYEMLKALGMPFRKQ